MPPPNADAHYLFSQLAEAVFGEIMPDFVFMAGPFADDATTRYHSLVKEPLRVAGIQVVRADEQKGAVVISNNVVALICRCAVVIADLTGSNKSVIYEVGLAMGLGKPVLLLVPKRAELPTELQSFIAIPMKHRDPSVIASEVLAEVQALLSHQRPMHELTRGQRILSGCRDLGIRDAPMISRELIFQVMRSATTTVRVVAMSGRSILVDSTELRDLAASLRRVDVRVVLTHPEGEYLSHADTIDSGGVGVSGHEIAVVTTRLRGLGMMVSYTRQIIPFGVVIVDDSVALVQYYFPGKSHTRAIIVENVSGGMFEALRTWCSEMHRTAEAVVDVD
jgi:nucleoside 2-deoxyribosyltransferase